MSTEARTLTRNLLFAVYPTTATTVLEPLSVGVMLLGAVGLLGRRRG